jgi:hypothetical protein
MLAFLLLSRENRWSSKSHHACMFGRVATEVNTVKIRPMGQMIWRFISNSPFRLLTQESIGNWSFFAKFASVLPLKKTV